MPERQHENASTCRAFSSFDCWCRSHVFKFVSRASCVQSKRKYNGESFLGNNELTSPNRHC